LKVESRMGLFVIMLFVCIFISLHLDLCANTSRSIAYFLLSYSHVPSPSDVHTYAPHISHNRTHRQLPAVGMGNIGLHPLVAADRHPRDACYSTNALPRALAMPTNYVEVTEAYYFFV